MEAGLEFDLKITSSLFQMEAFKRVMKDEEWCEMRRRRSRGRVERWMNVLVIDREGSCHMHVL